MATNPKIPPHKTYKDDHAHVDTVKGGIGRGWWPAVIIVVAAAILIALIFWLPRAPKRTPAPAAAQIPPQPTANQIQFTNLNMSTPTSAGAMKLTGNLFNNGNTAVNAISAQATFLNINGQPLETANVNLLGLKPDGTTQPFADNPIKPGESRPFQVQFQRVPEGWNRNLPNIRLTTVTAQGTSKSVPAGTAP